MNIHVVSTSHLHSTYRTAEALSSLESDGRFELISCGVMASLYLSGGTRLDVLFSLAVD